MAGRRTEFERPQRLKASHILVRVPPTGGSEAENKSKAKVEEAIRRAKAGEDFGKLAKELSEDTATAPQGGDLGFVGKGEMVPQFEEAVFALKKGEISPQPVRTPFGYHAIKVFDVQDGGVQPFREIAARIKEKLAAERSERAAETKADEARVALAAAKDFAAEAKTARPRRQGDDRRARRRARGDRPRPAARGGDVRSRRRRRVHGDQDDRAASSSPVSPSSSEPGVPPFADIKDKVVEAVKRERAQAAAEERAKAFAASVGTGDFLAIARRDKLPAGETPLFSRAEPPKDKDALPGPVLLAALRTAAGAISEPVRRGHRRLRRQDGGAPPRGSAGLRQGARPDAHPAPRGEAQRGVGAVDQGALHRRAGQGPGRNGARSGPVARMSIQRTPMTREGHTRLKDELERLKRVERPAIIDAPSPRRAPTATSRRTPSTTPRARSRASRRRGSTTSRPS